MTQSDAYTISQQLLDRLPEMVERARQIRSADPRDTIGLKAAAVAFSYYHPMREWGRVLTEHIEGYLNDEWLLMPFSLDKECEEAISVFICLGLGVKLGMYNAGDITWEEAEKFEWILMAFIASNSNRICERYRSIEEPGE